MGVSHRCENEICAAIINSLKLST